MFHRHKQRFESNIPESLDDFLGQEPGSVTCSFMFQVFLEKRLVAVSFTDLGEQSISSVYGIFEPELSPRSLGLYTLLQELEFARKRQLLYHYSGYGTVEPSHYDYKKQFHGLQAFDWETEAWAPLPRLLGKD
jgi:arginine-tRNA-protein transferase